MTVAHLHIWTTVDADDNKAVGLGNKAVVAPKVIERLAGTLAPVVFVIARNYENGFTGTIED